MSSRKPVYVIGVILLAIAMAAPQLADFSRDGINELRSAFELWYYNVGFGFSGRPGRLHSAEFCRDKFVFSDWRGAAWGELSGTGGLNISVWEMDPETGESTDLGWMVPGPGQGYFEPMAFENRLWLVSRFVGENRAQDVTAPNDEAFEIIDRMPRPCQFLKCPIRSGRGGSPVPFLLNGDPACVVPMIDGIVVSTWHAGAWDTGRYVVLPDSTKAWTFSTTQVRFDDDQRMTCIHQGDRIHTFLGVEGRTLYREGLELLPASSTTPTPVARRGMGIQEVQHDASNEPASALRTANTEDQIAGWSLVRDAPERTASWHVLHEPYGLLVSGQPAVLVVDDIDTGYPVGHLYLFDGTGWSEFANQPFPFGSRQFHVATRHDAQKAYIVATTSMGVEYVYSVDGAGVRATTGAIRQEAGMAPIYKKYLYWIETLGRSLAMGLIPGLGIWLLMWWYTKPDYAFGKQTVKLASVARRGLARSIDLAWILFSTVIPGSMMTRRFDWDSLAEAIALNADHPSVHAAARIAFMLGLWLIAVVFTLTAMQGRWGLTPGKWCCGIRTLRTTLRPCGFARSLVREILLCVDTCGFVCWTPGILSVALTNCRQRLGDRIADTSVFEASSL